MEKKKQVAKELDGNGSSVADADGGNWRRERSWSECVSVANLKINMKPENAYARQRRASEGASSLCARNRGFRRHHNRINRIHRNSQCAPNNNNEFLMEEHNDMIPDSSAFTSPDDEDDYQNKDFANAYNTQNADRLTGLSRAQLIYTNQLLEERVTTLERQVKELTEEKGAKMHDGSEDREEDKFLKPMLAVSKIRYGSKEQAQNDAFKGHDDFKIHVGAFAKRWNREELPKVASSSAPFKSTNEDGDQDRKHSMLPTFNENYAQIRPNTLLKTDYSIDEMH